MLSLTIVYTTIILSGDDRLEMDLTIADAEVIQAPSINALSMIVSNSKAKEQIFRSNFPLSDVQEFLSGYQNAMNKDDYLKNFTNEEMKKPSIIDQIEAAIVSVLNKYGLGYRVSAGGKKEMAQSALRESIKTFIFLLENWGCAQ